MSKPIRRASRRFWSDQKGATAIEYGLIAAGIAVMAVTGIRAAGGNLDGVFTAIASAVEINGGPPSSQPQGGPPPAAPPTNGEAGNNSS